MADATDDSPESDDEEGLPADNLNAEDPQPTPVQTGHDWLEETPAGATIPSSASDSQNELVAAALAAATESVDDEPGVLDQDETSPEEAAITGMDQPGSGGDLSQEDIQQAAEEELEEQALAASQSADEESNEDDTENEPVQAAPAAKASQAAGKKSSQENATKPAASAEPEPVAVAPHATEMKWYVLKVSSNQESSVRDSLLWRIKLEGLEEFFGEIVIPTEKVAEKTKTGKKRIVKRKLFPGYMMIHMVLNDETWYLVRDTNGISDFTGAAGKPIPMQAHEVARMLGQPVDSPAGTSVGKAKKEDEVTIDIPYAQGDTVKINDGSFEGWEGVIDKVDAVHGKITVMVKILGQETPVELEYWQVDGA